MPFGLRDRMGPRNHVFVGGPDPSTSRGYFMGKEAPTVVSCAKTAEPIDLPFGLWTRVGRRTRSVVFARWRQCTLMEGHIGATRRIWFNRPSAAAMRPYVKLLWPLVTKCCKRVHYCYRVYRKESLPRTSSGLFTALINETLNFGIFQVNFAVRMADGYK